MMQRGTALLWATLASGVLVSDSVEAHIQVNYPPTRYAFEPPDSNNQKTGPCATGAPTGTITPLMAGDELTVTWDEFIDHPGHFRIALDTTGTDAFSDPASEFDMAAAGNVVAYIMDTGGSSFSHTFTLPDVECDSCTLQVIQVMTDKLPWGPQNGADLYYWCSDISLARQTGAGGAGGAGAGGAGGTSGAPEDDDGETIEESSCSVGRDAGGGGSAWLLMLGVAALAALRRSSHHRHPCPCVAVRGSLPSTTPRLWSRRSFAGFRSPSARPNQARRRRSWRDRCPSR